MSDSQVPIVSVYATFGSDEEARRIARSLVEERLAACANILAPCHSIYRWQGNIEEAAEVPVLFKTRADTAGRLIERITELHSYGVPAVVVWPIARTLDAYRDWILTEAKTD